MRAAVCREHGKPVEIEDVCIRPPSFGEVEVAIEACAICHSDIHYIEGAWRGPLPAVVGHEAAGRVIRIGAGVTEYASNDRVLVTLLRTCGSCHNCSTGMPARCENKADPRNSPLTMADGAPLAQGLATAAFAERTVVYPSQLAPIPDDIPMESAALLSCGVITGVGSAVNTAAVEPGSAVAVIGTGGVGLNAIQGAVLCGASQIIAVDISERKLESAREFGATDVVLATKEKPYREVKKLTGGRGVDYAFVTVGSIDACEIALRYLCQGGSLVIVGMPADGAKMRLEPVIIAGLSQSLLGSCMGDTNLRRDIPYLIGLYRQKRLKLDELVTGTYPFDRINDAIRNTVEGKARRNVVMF